MQINFGLGILAMVPAGANPTPVQFAVLQDISLDISYNEKELRGSKMFAFDKARSGGKISGKAKVGNINGAMYTNLISGATQSTGSKIVVPSETGTVPTTPFTITVANGATFDTDLGVINQTTGLAMTRVASAPTTGQYSVNTTTGVYTFAAADTGKVMIFTYTYTAAAVGQTISVTNTLMGAAPTFLAIFGNTYKSKYHGAKIYACTSNKLGLGMKAEDYTAWDIDLSGMDDGTGKVFDLYTAE